MKTVVMVQARTGSSRMPGKALRPLHGYPMIVHVLRRAEGLGYPVILVTTNEDKDALLADEALKRTRCSVYRGDERDVLGRMCDAAAAYHADRIVRVTGDCPLWAPDIGADVVKLHDETGHGIVSNDTLTSGFADGTDTEVFSRDLLEIAHLHARVPETADRREQDAGWRDREHVTPWMRRATQHTILYSPEDWRQVKLSVDVLQDFELVERVLAARRALGYDWAVTRDALLALGFEPQEKIA